MIKRSLGAGVILMLNVLAAAAQAGTASTLLLTEVFYDTPGVDGDEEWIEIANFSEDVVQLSDYKAGDEENPGGREGMARFPEDAELAPGQAIVVSQTARGFRRLFGRNPDYEIRDTDPAVPDMRPYPDWASGELALANDGDELLLLDARNVTVDSINYGDSTTFFSPAIAGVYTGLSIARIPSNCDTNSAADWLPAIAPTPGQLFYGGECTPPAVPEPGDSPLSIGIIQGTSEVSPYVNQTVVFRGVVTGTYEDRNAAGIIFRTLFVQDLPGSEDGDPATSDGIAVFLGLRPVEFYIGDLLRINGSVTEFFGFTEIDDDGLHLSVEASRATLPDPIPLAPLNAIPSTAAYLETLEGMRVSLAGAGSVVGATHAGCEFHLLHPADNGQPVFQRRAEDDLGRIIPVLHTSDVRCDGFPDVKTGDSVGGVTGPLIFSFERYKIVQQEPSALDVTVSPLSAMPSPGELEDGQFSVATFNLYDHFDSISDRTNVDEPLPTAEELETKQLKLAQAIGFSLGCPTIIGVQEVENASLLLELAESLVEPCGFRYEVSHRESADARGLDLALLSNPISVVVTEVSLRQACAPLDTGILDESIDCPDGQYPLFSRPPLQVRLEIASEPYIVLVNHFKSKREGEAETTPYRLAQAQHIRSLAASWLAEDQHARIIVLGDFNDYEQSPALRIMTEAAGVLSNATLRVPDGERYSYIYGGASQLIDGILVSPSLIERVASVTIVHLNADFPAAYGQRRDASSLAYRSSDHDIPLMIAASADEPAHPLEAPTAPTLATTPPEPQASPTEEAAPATVTAPIEAPVEAPEAGRSDVMLSFAILLSLASYLLWRRRRI